MFAGLFRRRDSDSQNISPVHVAWKDLQIERLMKLYPEITEIQRNAEYKISVPDVPIPLWIKIYLPARFPQEKPIVTVSPPVRHPWVNEQQQVTGCPSLIKFNDTYSDLAEVIQEVVEEFQRRCPLPCMPTHAASLQGSFKSNFRIPLPQESHHVYDMPSFPTSFPELCDMRVEELRELGEDEDKLLAFLQKLPELQRITHDREQLCEENEGLARDNLAKQPELEAHKEALMRKIDTVNNLRHEFDEHCQKYQALSEQYAPNTIEENLRIAASDAEEESEKIASDFLDAKIDIETFLTRFMEKKMLSNVRRSKEERLHHQLMELKKSGF